MNGFLTNDDLPNDRREAQALYEDAKLRHLRAHELLEKGAICIERSLWVLQESLILLERYGVQRPVTPESSATEQTAPLHRFSHWEK